MCFVKLQNLTVAEAESWRRAGLYVHFASQRSNTVNMCPCLSRVLVPLPGAVLVKFL
jgi:hypothetical protein